MQDWSI